MHHYNVVVFQHCCNLKTFLVSDIVIVAVYRHLYVQLFTGTFIILQFLSFVEGKRKK